MAQTTKYHISYLDEDNQSVYDLTSDIPKYDKQQALSIEAALESIDLTEAVGDLNNLETTVKSSIVAAINELKDDEANVGSLDDLETTVKTSIVAAINEINGKADDIGDLTDLETTIKTSIVAAINELKGNITNLQATDATFATAINMKISSTEKGSNNGVAQLDSNGKVPSSQLPSYVDDIIEGYYNEGKFYTDSAHTTEITGEEGKIYVDLVTNKTYRWSSTIFVEISESLALGETSSTAYRGDKGKEAYDIGIQNKKDINELGNILYTREEKTSTNNQISFTGNENLEFSITEIDGKAEQNSYEGYQLIPYTLETLKAINTTGTWNNNVYTYNGITYTIEEENGYIKEIKTTGTANSNSILALINTMDIGAGTYYLSGCPNGGSYSTYFIYSGPGLAHNVSETPTTITLNEDTSLNSNNMRITILSGTSLSNLIWKPMLSKTNTTTFEPYIGGIASPNPDYDQDIKIVTGENKVRLRSKNLVPFPYSSQAGLIAGVTWSVNADGTINASGTADSTSSIFYLTNGDSDIYLDAGTYKISNNLFDDPHGFSLQAIQIVNGNYGTVYYNNMVLTERTRLRIRVIAKANTTVNVQNGYMMIEEGSTATAYQPYYLLEKPLSLGNMKLAQIGNYKDKIYKNLTNNKWYVCKNIDEMVFNGVGYYAKNSGDASNYLYYSTISNAKSGGLIADKLQFKSIASVNGGNSQSNVGISQSMAGTTIYFNVGYYMSENTLDEFKEFLQSNNISVLYILITSTDTEITDTTLISQLEDIQKLQQITGTNIVEIVSTEGNLNPEFKIDIETDTISYIKDNFVKNTDYATASKGGVIKGNVNGFYIGTTGNPLAGVYTNEQYQSLADNVFIGKGTLDNVLNTSIGDINTMLDQMNREVV